MREIKFRAKSRYGGDWVYGALLKDNVFTYVLSGNPKVTMGLQVTKEVAEVIPETVGQFTGRLDKNSREIYEGDIVRIEDSSNAIIEYSNLEAMFIFNFIGKWKIYGTWNTARKYIEIIGNIHEGEQQDE